MTFTHFARLALAAAALSLAACNGAGGSTGTATTSAQSLSLPASPLGTVARGAITSLGSNSVTLNGLEFDIGQAAIEVAGAPGTAEQLSVGQYVTVNGRQVDGRYVADRLTYDPSQAISGLEASPGDAARVAGQVSELGAEGWFAVGGVQVHFGEGTLLDGGTGVGLYDEVQVTGTINSDGSLEAATIQIAHAD